MTNEPIQGHRKMTNGNRVKGASRRFDGGRGETIGTNGENAPKKKKNTQSID